MEQKTILCIGGVGSRFNDLISIEAYNGNCWQKIGQIRPGRISCDGAVSVGNGNKLYVIAQKKSEQKEEPGMDAYRPSSGVVFDCLDLKTGVWTELAPLVTPRREMTLVAVGSDRIYALGGFTGEMRDQPCMHWDQRYKNTVDCYNISSNTWKTVASMSLNRSCGDATVYEGQIYAVGGHDEQNWTAICERYDPESDKWTKLAPMKFKRTRCAATVIGDFMYVIGGSAYAGEPLSHCERYSFLENKWATISPLSSPRGGVGAVAIDGKIFAIGGDSDKGKLNTTEIFDPVTNKWTAGGAPLKDARAFAGTVLCDVPMNDLKLE